MQTKALLGITATRALQEKLAQRFSSLGMEISVVCEMNVMKTKEIAILKRQLKHLSDYSWIGFTSQNGVKIFFETYEEFLKENSGKKNSLEDIKFAAIGSGTAKKLETYGYRADFVPDSYTVAAFAAGLCGIVSKEERILLPRAAKGSRELSDLLSLHNISYTEIPVYDVVGVLTENVHKLPEMQYLVFVSASGAEAFFSNYKKSLPNQVKIACIGEITAKKILERYGRVDLVAKVNDTEGLVKAISYDMSYFSLNNCQN